MWAKALVDTIASQEVLDTVAEWLQPEVSGVLKRLGEPGQDIKNFLNGTWLGHPLHPVLTDVPIGAWSCALVFDLASMDAAADVSVALGLVAAVGTAVTGIIDWSDTYGRAQRIGVAHAALNITSTVLYATSLIARQRHRGFGKLLAFAGYGVLNAGAFLGGELVFSEQIGINHAAAELSDEFVPVLEAAKLPNDSPTRVDAKGVPVLLVRRHDNIHALLETCSHLGGPLSEGTLQEGTVVCPWHGSRFCLESGAVIDGPATHPQPCFETRIANGQIEVRSPR